MPLEIKRWSELQGVTVFVQKAKSGKINNAVVQRNSIQVKQLYKIIRGILLCDAKCKGDARFNLFVYKKNDA